VQLKEKPVSIDHSYTQIDGKWVRTDQRVVDGHGENIPDANRPDFRTDFWVDLCHGAGVLIDERYYFPGLAAAMEFYVEGWKDRQYRDNDSQPCGIDHMGLYSRGRLVHGHSIHGDEPGSEGENLRQICEVVAKEIDEGSPDRAETERRGKP
jgi:hypothetical protein